MRISLLLSVISIGLLCQSVAADISTSHTPNFAQMLPNGEAWLSHVDNGLSPYWMMESAYGEPVGNFPTFRCDNGDVLDVAAPCVELANHSWISDAFGRDYTRMKSRQIYAYGVRYHLTGDPEALRLAKAGVDYLLSELRDRDNGGMLSFRQSGQSGQPGLNWQQRTSQDQAYAIVGLAFYYYLTRDAEVERALIEQQKFIFDTYRTKDNDQLLWVLEDSDEDKKAQRELVAQLDQINGYLLLVMPLLPEPHQQKWRDDLQWLTTQMLALYHNQEEWRFYGAIHHPAMQTINAKHNDYGHTIKAYWMTYLTGKALGNEQWQTLAQQGMHQTIEKAAYNYPKTNLIDVMSKAEYDAIPFEQIYSWQDKPYSYGASSWQWAELDQAVMTLAMIEGRALNPDLVKQLYFTTTAFQHFWVDPEFGGVGLKPKSVKQFQWGNGYHQYEHALVGYISAQSWHEQPASLYYALPHDSNVDLQPYYYSGALIDKQTTEVDLSIPDLVQVRVQFNL
ncbi:N-acylglucosamine 2-epimerase [Vibrio sp. FNV 38]|nr:N-acylglucosamine 2-epimerase [Vibrio sp. FNV 38]